MSHILHLCLYLLLSASTRGFVHLPRLTAKGVWTTRISSSSSSEDFDFDLYNPGDDPRERRSDIEQGAYRPSMGFESFLFTLGNSRLLYPTEYELAFSRFPGLREQAMRVDRRWPSSSERQITEAERLCIESIGARLAGAEPSDEDIARTLSIFRKTILGLEKYRINDPANVAGKYCDMIRTCLAVEDGWGAAANSLAYAGLVFRDHVEEPDNELGASSSISEKVVPEDDGDVESEELMTEEGTGGPFEFDFGDDPDPTGLVESTPLLRLNSLFLQAAERLLDLEFTGKKRSFLAK